MDFEEYAAKPLLAAAGITIPRGESVTTAEEAAAAAVSLGPVVVKAQVPTGKRGKAGGIKPADDAAGAEAAAATTGAAGSAQDPDQDRVHSRDRLRTLKLPPPRQC